jgi:hypothetical protein
MSNYKIEDNIDFYKELYNSLDYDSDKETNKETNTKTNICQITGSELKDKYVTLECSHKFNYDALYTDICKQKFEFNSYTTDVLCINDLKRIKDSNVDYYIKCPYCRNIQLELLPYYEELPFTKKYGVNTNDTDYRVIRTSNSNNGPYSYKMYGYTFKKGSCCKMVTKNNKQIPCYNSYSTELMTYDGLSKEYSVKHFCPIHIRGESKQNKIEIQKKKFEDKMKAKEEKMKAKEDKLKIKEEKLKIKEDKKINSISLTKPKLSKQNIVISTENTVSEFSPLDSLEPSQLCLGCNAVLKTGSKKGSICGVKIYENNVCKRHNIFKF